jgi:hypothetical protein
MVVMFLVYVLNIKNGKKVFLDFYKNMVALVVMVVMVVVNVWKYKKGKKYFLPLKFYKNMVVIVVTNI